MENPVGPNQNPNNNPPQADPGTPAVPTGLERPVGPQPEVPPQSAPTPPPKKKLGKWKVWLLALAGVLLLGGAGAFAYFGYYLPNQPKNVIGKALQNFLLADSFSFSGSSEFSQQSGGELSNIGIEVNGAMDVSTGDVSSFWLDSRLNYSSAAVDAKLRGQDQQLYVNLSGLIDSSSLITGLVSGQNLEELGLGAAISQLLSSIEDTWFVFDTSDLAPVEQSERISEADRNKAFDILSGYKLFVVVSEEGDQTVNGRQASGYQIELDFDQLKLALKEIASADYESLEFDDSLVGNIESALETDDSEEIPEHTLQVWVYGDDKTLAMLRFEVSDEQGSATTSLTFDNYNQPVEVEIPEEATPAEELLSTLFGF